MVRTTIYGFIGWQVGTLYTTYAKETDQLELIGCIVVLVIVLGYLIYKKKERIEYTKLLFSPSTTRIIAISSGKVATTAGTRASRSSSNISSVLMSGLLFSL